MRCGVLKGITRVVEYELHGNFIASIVTETNKQYSSLIRYYNCQQNYYKMICKSSKQDSNDG